MMANVVRESKDIQRIRKQFIIRFNGRVVHLGRRSTELPQLISTCRGPGLEGSLMLREGSCVSVSSGKIKGRT